jgi:hypothetical protein
MMNSRGIPWKSRKGVYTAALSENKSHRYRHHSLTLLLDGKLSLAPLKEGPKVSYSYYIDAGQMLKSFTLESARCGNWYRYVIHAYSKEN